MISTRMQLEKPTIIVIFDHRQPNIEGFEEKNGGKKFGCKEKKNQCRGKAQENFCP